MTLLSLISRPGLRQFSTILLWSDQKCSKSEKKDYIIQITFNENIQNSNEIYH